MILELWS